MLLQEGLFYLLKHKIPFLEDLYEQDNKKEIIKRYLQHRGFKGRQLGKKFEMFLAERLKHQGKIFLNVKFECQGQFYEYDIVSVLPNGDCDYFEVKWNIGDINILMENRLKNKIIKYPRDIEMMNLLGKPKNIISYIPINQDDIFPQIFEFKNIYFISLENNIIFPTKGIEIFFSYLCQKVVDGWYIGKNKNKDRFYFRKTYEQSPIKFAVKLFKDYITISDGNFFFKNEINKNLDKISTEPFFDFSKEEFEDEFKIKFPGLVIYQSKNY